MFFSVITKNLNWEILTKNLVTFKRWVGLRMKNFNIMGVLWKFGGGGWVTKQCIGRNCLKSGAWTVCRFKGTLGEKEGVCIFEGEVDTPMHTMFAMLRYLFMCRIG